MSFLDPINQLPMDFRFTSSNPKLLEQMQEKTAALVKTYEALRQERQGKKKYNKTKKYKISKIFQKYIYFSSSNFVRIG